MLASDSLLLNIGIFTVSAAAIWRAGVTLEHRVDAIAAKTGLGHVLAGTLLLAVATSLPEIATTVTASLRGQVSMATNNLFGGIGFQTAVLALSDLALDTGTLSYIGASFKLLLQGVGLMLLLLVALLALAFGRDVSFLGIGGFSYLILSGYVAFVWILYRIEDQPRWEPVMNEIEQSHLEDLQDSEDDHDGSSLGSDVLYFLLAAGIVLFAGWAIVDVSSRLTEQFGLSKSFFGAVFVAITTSLPEVSTTFTAMRNKHVLLAISNILGTNAVCVALLFLVDAVSAGDPVFTAGSPETIFNAVLGTLMTALLLWGLLTRNPRTVEGLGWNSIALLCVFAAGLFLFYAEWGRAGS